MRGYTTISDEEKNSILQRHSSFYNGFAVGNVPNEPRQLRVDKGASDPNGITVDNKGNVKTYHNHKINESITSEQKKETNEIEVDDMDISDEESAYSFKSDGPEQFDSSYSDDSYGLDIDSIMQMFGNEISPADIDMDFNDDETDEFEGYFEDSVEGDPYDYMENGGFMDEQVESETCEQCGSEMSEGECMECGSMYEEIDDELHESFKENTKVIKEMFNRFSKFN